MKTSISVLTICLLTMMNFVGCGKSKPAATSNPKATETVKNAANAIKDSVLPSSVFLSKKPANASSIQDLKKTAKEGDEIVIEAFVGGSHKPFIENFAIMEVVDKAQYNRCSASADDHCKTPWDYCCAPLDELNSNKALVQIVGTDGKPLKVDLNKSTMIKPLSLLTIKATVNPRPNPEILAVKATGIYVN